MTKLLQINSSLSSDAGQSTQLADAFVARWRAQAPAVDVTRRSLADEPVPHLSRERFHAALTPLAERTDDQHRAAAPADALIEELVDADVLVLGVPVYNFQIPSTLKAWFDHVARAGTTFRYTPQGPEGLLGSKRAFVFIASGGRYHGTDSDFTTPYLRHLLGFLGIDAVSFIHAEGLAMGEEVAREALQAATTRIERLAA